MKEQHQRYTPEFRVEAVKLVTEKGFSHKAAATRLSIPKGTLASWVAGTDGECQQALRPLAGFDLGNGIAVRKTDNLCLTHANTKGYNSRIH